MKKNFLLPLLFTLLAVFGLQSCASNDYIAITGFAQGGTYTVKLSLRNSDGRLKTNPESIKEGVDSVLKAIDFSLSGYNKASLLSRFNAGEYIWPDKIFSDIYRISYEYYKETNGCFDPSAASLFDIWGFGFTTDSLPGPAKIKEVMANIGMDGLTDSLVIDEEGRSRSILCRKSAHRELKLNYNAIAQGYSCDLVADYLRSLGVESMLVDVGGEIFCQGLNPSGQRWSIGLDRPVDGNDRPGEDMQGVFYAGPEPCGVVTSGNYRKFYVKDGRKYAHTIDPRTGYPVTHSLLSATVIAPDATEADALATYCMVIGYEDAKAFIESRPDLEACLVWDEDGEMKVWTSSGMDFSAQP